MTKDGRKMDKNDPPDGNFDADVKALIRVSAGAELCATKENKVRRSELGSDEMRRRFLFNANTIDTIYHTTRFSRRRTP